MKTVFMILMSLSSVAAFIHLPSDCINSAYYGGYPRRCICKSGLGQGDFCCALEGYDICTIMDNLVLQTTDEVAVYLSLPCHQIVSSFIMYADDNHDVTCEFEISTAGAYVEKGVIFNDQLLVTVEFSDNDKPLEVKFFRNVSGETFSTNYETRPMEVNDILPYEIAIQTTVGEVKFFIEHSLENNMWRLSGCNTIISFRRNQNQKAIQDQVPGICVKRNREYLKARADTLAGNVCDMNKDENYPDFSFRATGIVDQIVQNYENLAQAYPTFGNQDMTTSCDALQHYYRQCPEHARKNSLEFCKTLVVNQVTRRCLYEVDNDVNILDLFTMCIGAQCGVSLEACEIVRNATSLKRCFPHNFDCNE